jgi:antitoxin (DNA-binding transcriptional repressor) of toxin-antitoxin stability system
VVNINQGRMWTVTDARPKLNALVADAQSGQITHIVSGGQVVAHIVPANTWIIDDQLALEMMLTALIRQEVTWASRAEEWSDGELDHVGDALGRVLGWAWRTDPDRIFMKAITDYVGRLSQVVGRRLTLQDIRPAMSKGLGGGALGLSEVAAALTYADQHWDEWALPAPFDLPDDDAKTSQ